MKVRIASPLHSYTGQRAEVEATGGTLAELLADLDRRYPGIRFRIVDEQDRVRPQHEDLREPDRRPGARHQTRAGGRNPYPAGAERRLALWGRNCCSSWPRSLAAIAAFQLLVALYGGFFGAGIGILMLAALGLLGMKDIHRMNGLKNLAAVCINGLAALTFTLTGRADWPTASFMIVGGVLGGYGGAGMARWLGQVLVRRLVIGIGLVISAYLAIRLVVAP